MQCLARDTNGCVGSHVPSPGGAAEPVPRPGRMRGCVPCLAAAPPPDDATHAQARTASTWAWQRNEQGVPGILAEVREGTYEQAQSDAFLRQLVAGKVLQHKEKLRHMFSRMDVNGNARLEKDEFMEAVGDGWEGGGEGRRPRRTWSPCPLAGLVALQPSGRARFLRVTCLLHGSAHASAGTCAWTLRQPGRWSESLHPTGCGLGV